MWSYSTTLAPSCHLYKDTYLKDSIQPGNTLGPQSIQCEDLIVLVCFCGSNLPKHHVEPWKASNSQTEFWIRTKQDITLPTSNSRKATVTKVAWQRCRKQRNKPLDIIEYPEANFLANNQWENTMSIESNFFSFEKLRYFMGKRGSSVVKIMCCSCRRAGLDSQNAHGAHNC